MQVPDRQLIAPMLAGELAANAQCRRQDRRRVGIRVQPDLGFGWAVAAEVRLQFDGGEVDPVGAEQRPILDDGRHLVPHCGGYLTTQPGELCVAHAAVRNRRRQLLDSFCLPG